MNRNRAGTAGAAVVVGLATAALPLAAGGAAVRAQLLLAAPGLVALGAGLIGWIRGFTVAAVALATEYALRLQHHHGLDAFAVIEAVALFATVEIGLRSLEARAVARPEPGVRRTAQWQLLGLLGGGAASAFVVLAFGGRSLPAPTAGFALGLAAAATVVVAAEGLRRRVTRAANP